MDPFNADLIVKPRPAVPDQATPVKAAAVRDRRRPGRPDTVNPALLPLLRGEVPEGVQDADSVGHVAVEEIDALAAARGIGLAMVLSALIWVPILAMIRRAL